MAANVGTRSADIHYFTRNAATTGYQLGSLLAPPLYVVSAIASRGRSSFTIKRLLRATWLCGLGGSIAGGIVGYAWYSFPDEDILRAKRQQAVYDINRIRANDHAMIGTIIMGVLTPALFWNRAHVVDLVLGGAGLGSGIGLLTHYGRSLSGDRPPKTQVPILDKS